MTHAEVYEMSLQLTCPHCKTAYDDALEVLNPDALVPMRCEVCERSFALALMECHRCAHEEVFTWAHEPPVMALSLLTCGQCGSAFRLADDSAKGSFVGP